MTDEQIDAIMEQAQVFASAWSLVGGPFDSGGMLENAHQEKAELRALLSASKPAVAQSFEAWAMQEGLISESHGVRFVNSMCDVAQKTWNAALADSPAAPAQSGEPIYQVWVEETSSYADVTHEYYLERLPSSRRIVYAAPQPAQTERALTARERALIAEYAQYYHGAKSLNLAPFTFDEYVSKCNAGEF